MNKQFSATVGIVLILLGASVLVFNLVMPVLGLNMWRLAIWRFWPLIVVGLGLLFVLPPLLAPGRRGLGALFIPGMPVLATGAILLFTSVFHVWSAWRWLWPLEVLAVGSGLLLAAIWMRTIWLLIPAIVVGANGMVFQFCALTGWWEAWSVLWTVEPLAAGLAFLLIGAVKRLSGLFLAGVILCGLGGLGLVGMTIALPGWWLIKLAGPVILVGVGFLLLVWGVSPRRLSPAPAAE